MNWTKRDIASLKVAIFSGALRIGSAVQSDEATDARERAMADARFCRAAAIASLRELRAIREAEACGLRRDLERLETEPGFRKDVDYFRKTWGRWLKEAEAKVRFYSKLLGKVEAADVLPPEALGKEVPSC